MDRTAPAKARKRPKKIALAALSFVAIAAIVLGIYQFIWPAKRKSLSGAPFQTMRMTRLTHTGKARTAAISPDGKYLVYAIDEGGKQSLWLRQVATASDVQIVAAAEGQYYMPTFSQDGNYIYYVQVNKERTLGTLYHVAALGGASRRLLTDIDSPVTLSPDGRQLAFVRHLPGQGESALMVADADGTAERKLATRKNPDSFRSAAWSPDGKVVAVSEGLPQRLKIVAVPTGRGSERIMDRKWDWIGSLAWLSDGSGLLISAAEEGATTRQIWQISYPNGEARRITNDLNRYWDVTATTDATALASVQFEIDSSLWMVPEGGPTQARQLTSGAGQRDGSGGLTWTPQGAIVYSSISVGMYDLWMRNAEGGSAKQLTTDGRYNTMPFASPDGKTIVFTSNRSGKPTIWRVDDDGRNLRRLTSGDLDWAPEISPDGKWVVYVSSGSGKEALWRVPIGGGEPTQLTQRHAVAPSISADGKWVAFQSYDDQTHKTRIAIMPFEGGEPTKILDITPARTPMGGPTPLHWTPEDQAITYVDTRNGVSNIWSQQLSGGPPKQLTHFTSDQIFWYAWSGDGKQLALSRGNQTSDVVLITNFR